ncbi:MAG: serine/threonine protein kinase, partial [Polyangiaceae bacterium]|nr:serine/threonine protein kinase [Polyangiaceae bacterium]
MTSPALVSDASDSAASPDGGSSPPNRYAEGDVIAGKYRLTRVLGEGGMGAVWLARQLTLDIDVAIKLIRHEVATVEASERLLQEARAAARLGHPSICRVFEFGETEQQDPFIVMEVLTGESLGDLLERKSTLPPIKAVQALLPICSALVAAHGRGIVHRDIKPDNIVLTKDDSGTMVPKLVDFGIAKLHREEPVRILSSDALPEGTPSCVTQAGVIVGSPDYMSPEQAQGANDVDHRCDVWSLCVVLYEIITGERPFDGYSYQALVASILLNDPKPTTDYGVGDEELWHIVRRGLAKDREERWQDMRSLGQALASWALDQRVATDIAGTSLRAHWLTEQVQRPLSEAPPSFDEEALGALLREEPSFESGTASPVPRGRDRRGVRAVLASAVLLLVAGTMTVLVLAPWRNAEPKGTATGGA